MGESPIVSIVIPVWNAEEFIAQTLESALGQSLSNIEVVCVDDCSIDGSVEIIRGYMERDSRIRLIRFSENQKVSAARNAGIVSALGEYILPLDADDLIDSNYCAEAMKVFKDNPLLSVVYCEANKFNETENWYWELRPYSQTKILERNMVFVSAFFRKSDWAAVGGYKSNMAAGYEDWDFWLSFVERGKLFYRIPRVLFHYRQRENSRNDVGKNKKIKREIFALIRKNHPNLYRFWWLREFSKVFVEVKSSSKGVLRIKVLKVPVFKIKPK